MTSTAARPDQRCSVPIQCGARTGIRPYMISAEVSWTSASTNASVASQALAAVPEEKPARLNAKEVASCRRAYTPSPTDTSVPIPKARNSVVVRAELAAGVRRVHGAITASAPPIVRTVDRHAVDHDGVGAGRVEDRRRHLVGAAVPHPRLRPVLQLDPADPVEHAAHLGAALVQPGG